MTTQEYGVSKVINEYWCWRAKYCHNKGEAVCGRDARVNTWRKFQNACAMYKYNCRYGHGFTATSRGPPVCGFDDNKSFLAEFEDLCTLYKINCQKIGIFTLVEENICTGQKRFETGTNPFNLPSELIGKQKW
ncbi:unnamed protein product [Colias eurytheme]|nr:unnamed protein product [Colias eurytheme]